MIVLTEVVKKWTLFPVVLVVAFGCSDDDEKKMEQPGASEVTVDGGRYSNLTAKATDPATAVYSPTEGMTSVSYTAEVSGETFLVVVAFPGQQQGQYEWTEETSFVSVMQYFDDADKGVTASHLGEENTVHSGFVKIDKYGAAGGVISGSFEGDVTIVDTECSCLEEGTVKGKFSAHRLQ